jgi:hypothetical protein
MRALTVDIEYAGGVEVAQFRPRHPKTAGALHSAALDLTFGRTEERAPDVKTMPS